MNKFDATVKFVIKAETRSEAWQKAEDICRNHLRDLATVISVSQSLPDPQNWIAINESIKRQS